MDATLGLAAILRDARTHVGFSRLVCALLRMRSEI